MPNDKIIIAGARGGKSFQAGYDAGYAQCKLDIAKEPPGTEEMKWLRKMKYAIMRGHVNFHISAMVTDEANHALESFALRRAIEYTEEQEARYIEYLQETIDRLKASQPDWTPCAEGQNLPTEKGVYNVTALISRRFRKETVSAPASYDPEREDCTWDILNVPEDYDYYFVIAWQPLPAPYNPDHNANADQFREPTKMMQDHFVDANKKVGELVDCETCGDRGTCTDKLGGHAFCHKEGSK